MIKYNGNEYSISGVKSIKYNGNEYAKQSTGETWVINDRISSVLSEQTIGFTSNDISFGSISAVEEPDPMTMEIHINIYYGGTVVYINDIWLDSAYRTVTFETSPTGDLLTWLQANAVKQ